MNSNNLILDDAEGTVIRVLELYSQLMEEARDDLGLSKTNPMAV